MTDLILIDSSTQLIDNFFSQLQAENAGTFNTGASPTDPCLWDGSCPQPVHGYGSIGD